MVPTQSRPIRSRAVSEGEGDYLLGENSLSEKRGDPLRD